MADPSFPNVVPCRHTDVTLQAGQPLRRREFLCWLPAFATAFGIPWRQLFASEAPNVRRHGKSCIVLWMRGGPSPFDTFSPLVGHPNGGDVKAISTTVPGIHIAEHLPNISAVMNDICLIRSLNSKEGSHPRASYLLHTGYLPNPSVRHPAFGANVVHQLADAAADLPAYVRIGGNARDGAGGGLLGVEFDPFVINDPRRPPDNTRPNTGQDRFQRRVQLVQSWDQQFAERRAMREAMDHQRIYEQAARMVLSSDMDVFDLSREPESIRAAYGDTEFAAGCLLARRLVERGVGFVEVQLGNWDTHQDNARQCRSLCQRMDQPMAALLRDLKDRGRLDQTLIVWMGEFGRTPRINPRGGRDHFPQAFTVALAGCGVRGGQVIGQLDRGGTTITDRPITVPDLFRSWCEALAINPHAEHVTATGRPLPVVEGGAVIDGLLA